MNGKKKEAMLCFGSTDPNFWSYLLPGSSVLFVTHAKPVGIGRSDDPTCWEWSREGEGSPGHRTLRMT